MLFTASVEQPPKLPRPCDDGPLAELGNRVEQLATALDRVGEDVTQLGKDGADVLQQRHGAVIVLGFGRVHRADYFGFTIWRGATTKAKIPLLGQL